MTDPLDLEAPDHGDGRDHAIDCMCVWCCTYFGGLMEEEAA